MMGHVLLKEDGFAVRDRSGKPVHNLAPIILISANDLLGARMRDAGLEKIMGVKRLVADERVGAVAPRPHHGGGDIPWFRPHGGAPRAAPQPLSPLAF